MLRCVARLVGEEGPLPPFVASRFLMPGRCGGAGVGSEEISPAAYAASLSTSWRFFRSVLGSSEEEAAQRDNAEELENRQQDRARENTTAQVGVAWVPPLPGTRVRRQVPLTTTPNTFYSAILIGPVEDDWEGGLI